MPKTAIQLLSVSYAPKDTNESCLLKVSTKCFNFSFLNGDLLPCRKKVLSNTLHSSSNGIFCFIITLFLIAFLISFFKLE